MLTRRSSGRCWHSRLSCPLQLLLASFRRQHTNIDCPTMSRSNKKDGGEKQRSIDRRALAGSIKHSDGASVGCPNKRGRQESTSGFLLSRRIQPQELRAPAADHPSHPQRQRRRSSYRSRREVSQVANAFSIMLVVSVLLMFSLCLPGAVVEGFVVGMVPRRRSTKYGASTVVFEKVGGADSDSASNGSGDASAAGRGGSDSSSPSEHQFGDGGGVVLADLNWRVEKLRLEEQNRKRFLKSKPRFLPYEECRKWVKAWHRWENEQDWRDWIAMGEKRNAYIPVSRKVPSERVLSKS